MCAVHNHTPPSGVDLSLDVVAATARSDPTECDPINGSVDNRHGAEHGVGVYAFGTGQPERVPESASRPASKSLGIYISHGVVRTRMVTPVERPAVPTATARYSYRVALVSELSVKVTVPGGRPAATGVHAPPAVRRSMSIAFTIRASAAVQVSVLDVGVVLAAASPLGAGGRTVVRIALTSVRYNGLDTPCAKVSDPPISAASAIPC
jgi:hypothetical protein